MPDLIRQRIEKNQLLWNREYNKVIQARHHLGTPLFQKYLTGANQRNAEDAVKAMLSITEGFPS